MTKYKGFSYTWHEGAFLTPSQAQYALERLWVLTAGKAEWQGEPVIEFAAVNREQVEATLNLAPDTLPWIPLTQVLPINAGHNLDTESLPALWLVDEFRSMYYDGSGAYPIDLVTATFILLTRWEEWVNPVQDQIGNHQEASTLCSRQNFRERPVLDEWASVLRPWLQKQNPAWQADLPKPSLWISHDIDHLCYYKNPWRVVRGFMRGILYQKSIEIALRNLKEGVVALTDPRKDPCVRSISELMSLDESLEQHGTFFFMTAKSSEFDDGYQLDIDWAKGLLQDIKKRGHEVAWHPGYEAAENDVVFVEELSQLRQLTNTSSVGVRHHYLRWQAGSSWKRLADNGITFDGTLGYNRHLGFRASTANFYPAYSLLDDIPLSLEVRPLIVMDGHLLQNPATVAENINILMRRCHAVNGCFTILVHNYTLMVNSGASEAIRSGIEKAKK